MDDVGDDFGDIYEDVEVHALHATNGTPIKGLFYRQPGDDGKDAHATCEVDSTCSVGKNVNEMGNDPLHSVGPVPTEISSILEEGDNDSEDDLDIISDDDRCFMHAHTTGIANGVLGVVEGPYICNSNNDVYRGPDMGFVHQGSERQNGQMHRYLSKYAHYKYKWPGAAEQSSPIEASSASGSASFSLLPFSDVCGDNRCNQKEVSSLLECSHIFGGGSAYLHYFPFYRTDMDVRIGSFKQKAWTYPGADVTDFFNFGFDEESWKAYYYSLCKMVDIIPSRKLQHKGRAIQVENSSYERQPSIDSRRPPFRDSDAIQILLQEDVELSYESSLPDTIEKDEGMIRASVLKDIVTDEKLDCLCSELASENGVAAFSSTDSFKKHDRFFELENTTNPVAHVANNNSDHLSDAADGHHENDVFQSDVRNADPEDAGKDTADNDVFSIGSEPSLSVDGHELNNSLELESHSDACERDIYIDTENADTNLQERVSAISYSGKDFKDGLSRRHNSCKPLDSEAEICENINSSSGRKCSMIWPKKHCHDHDTPYFSSLWCSSGMHRQFYVDRSLKKKEHSGIMHDKRDASINLGTQGCFGHSKKRFSDKPVDCMEAKESYQRRVWSFRGNADQCPQMNSTTRMEYSLERQLSRGHIKRENDFGYFNQKLKVSHAARLGFWKSRRMAEMQTHYRRRRIGYRERMQRNGNVARELSGSLDTDVQGTHRSPVSTTNVRGCGNFRRLGVCHARSPICDREKQCKVSYLPLDYPMCFESRSGCIRLADQRYPSPEICRGFRDYDMLGWQRKSRNKTCKSRLTQKSQRGGKQSQRDVSRRGYWAEWYGSDYDGPDGTIHNENNVDFLKGSSYCFHAKRASYAMNHHSHGYAGNDLFLGRMPYFSGQSPKHESISDKKVSGDSGIYANLDQLSCDGNESGSVVKINADNCYSNIYRDEIRRAEPSSRNLANVKVVQGKFLRRCRWNQTRTFKGKVKKRKGNLLGKDQITVENGSNYRYDNLEQAAGRTDTGKKRSDEKCLDKFLAFVKNDVGEVGGVVIKESTFNGEPSSKAAWHSEDGGGGSDGCNDNAARIIAIISKMEKRIERFKDPVHVKMATEKNESLVSSVVEIQPRRRPVRKRRWAG